MLNRGEYSAILFAEKGGDDARESSRAIFRGGKGIQERQIDPRKDRGPRGDARDHAPPQGNGQVACGPHAQDRSTARTCRITLEIDLGIPR